MKYLVILCSVITLFGKETTKNLERKRPQSTPPDLLTVTHPNARCLSSSSLCTIPHATAPKFSKNAYFPGLRTLTQKEIYQAASVAVTTQHVLAPLLLADMSPEEIMHREPNKPPILELALKQKYTPGVFIMLRKALQNDYLTQLDPHTGNNFLHAAIENLDDSRESTMNAMLLVLYTDTKSWTLPNRNGKKPIDFVPETKQPLEFSTIFKSLLVESEQPDFYKKFTRLRKEIEIM